MTKRIITLWFWGIFIISSLYSEHLYSLNGIVTDKKGRLLSDVQVILIETDKYQITNKRGEFIFNGLRAGGYTILLIYPGYQEKRVSVRIPFRATLKIVLSPIVLDMGKIFVNGSRKIVSSENGATVFSREAIEKLPTGGNPFRIVEKEGGIAPLLISSSDEGNVFMYLPFKLYSETNGSEVVSSQYSFLGGEPTWTHFYYDYIEIPRTMHLFGFPFPSSVIQEDAVESVKLWRGGTPVSLNDSNSGSVIVYPVSEVGKGETLLTPSITEISLLLSRNTKGGNVLVGLRKSLFEITVWPFIDMGTGVSEYSGCGDLLLRYLYKKNEDTINVDLLFFGDYHISSNDFEGNVSVYEKNVFYPFFVGVGTRWKKIVGDSIVNVISVSGGFSNTNSKSFRGDSDSSLKVISDMGGRSTDFSFKEKLSWLPLNFLSVSVGVSNRYGRGDVFYTSYEDEYPDRNLNAENFRVSPFIETTLSVNPFTVSLGGLLAIDKRCRYKVVGKVDWKIMRNLNLFFNVAKGPIYISTVNSLMKSINNVLLGLEDKEESDLGLESFFSEIGGVYKLGSLLSIGLTGYYTYYWNISGFNPLTAYYNGDDLRDGIIFTTEGRYYGGSIVGSLGNNLNYLSVGYTMSCTEYYSNILGWVRANNDIRHIVKISGFLTLDGWVVGGNFMVFLNKPFTPVIVDSVDYYDGNPSPVYRFGKFNSATDNFPRFRLDINIFKKFKIWGKKCKVFLNTTNLLVFLNPFLAGLKDKYRFTVGATTAKEYMRKYVFDDSFSLIGSELGIKINL